jgi:hypothetical protein
MLSSATNPSSLNCLDVLCARAVSGREANDCWRVKLKRAFSVFRDRNLRESKLAERLDGDTVAAATWQHYNRVQ